MDVAVKKFLSSTVKDRQSAFFLGPRARRRAWANIFLPEHLFGLLLYIMTDRL